jgi:peptidyl-prolyl cis-trans isomerase D
MIRPLSLVLLLFAIACGPGVKGGGPTMNNKMNAPEIVPQGSPVVSAEILAREPLTNSASVKHILVSWKGVDNSSQERSKADAEALVKDIQAQLAHGAEFDAMMKKYSEDPGSAKTGRAYDVTPSSQLVIEFKQLALRLRVDEVGVVQSDYGFHVMTRLQ